MKSWLTFPRQFVSVSNTFRNGSQRSSAPSSFIPSRFPLLLDYLSVTVIVSRTPGAYLAFRVRLRSLRQCFNALSQATYPSSWLGAGTVFFVLFQAQHVLLQSRPDARLGVGVPEHLALEGAVVGDEV